MKLWQLFSLGRGALLLAEQVSQQTGAQHVLTFDERVGKALADHGHRVTRLDPAAPIAIEGGSLDGVCFNALAEEGDPVERLRAALHAVRPGGYVLSATPTRLGGDQATDCLLSAAFLHAGLGELRQQRWRGLLLTSGRVRGTG